MVFDPPKHPRRRELNSTSTESPRGTGRHCRPRAVYGKVRNGPDSRRFQDKSPVCTPTERVYPQPDGGRPTYRARWAKGAGVNAQCWSARESSSAVSRRPWRAPQEAIEGHEFWQELGGGYLLGAGDAVVGLAANRSSRSSCPVDAADNLHWQKSFLAPASSSARTIYSLLVERINEKWTDDHRRSVGSSGPFLRNGPYGNQAYIPLDSRSQPYSGQRSGAIGLKAYGVAVRGRPADRAVAGRGCERGPAARVLRVEVELGVSVPPQRAMAATFLRL
jgi:hypothetical protein